MEQENSEYGMIENNTWVTPSLLEATKNLLVVP